LQKTLCSAPESMPATRLARHAAPTAEEDALVEQKVGISVPTRDEMQEIEPSSRLYTENGTAT
jgi:magnesium transporter